MNLRRTAWIGVLLLFAGGVFAGEKLKPSFDEVTLGGVKIISWDNVSQIATDNTIPVTKLKSVNAMAQYMFPRINADNTIEYVLLDNTVVGGTYPSIGSFTVLNNSGLHTSSGGSLFPDGISAYFGTDSDFSASYDATNYKLIFATDNGAALSDDHGMFTFRTGVGTATGAGQRVFAVEDNVTPVFYVTKEGNTVQTGTHTATQYITDCSSTDNTCYINMLNEGAPSDPSVGDHYYDNTTKAPKWWNGTAWTSASADSMAWDNVTDKPALPQIMPFVLKGYSTDDNTMLLWKADQAQTLTQLDCMTGGADNVTITLYECDSSGASCATTGLVATATSAGAADTSASNGSIDANDWVRVYVESIVGTPTYVSCTARYTVAMP
jgi:hypothetical protein